MELSNLRLAGRNRLGVFGDRAPKTRPFGQSDNTVGCIALFNAPPSNSGSGASENVTHPTSWSSSCRPTSKAFLSSVGPNRPPVAPAPAWSREAFRVVESLDIPCRRSDENPHHQDCCDGPSDVEEKVLPTQNVNGRLVQQH